MHFLWTIQNYPFLSAYVNFCTEQSHIQIFDGVVFVSFILM